MATFRIHHIKDQSIGVIPSHGYVSRSAFGRDAIRRLEYVSQSKNIWKTLSFMHIIAKFGLRFETRLFKIRKKFLTKKIQFF